MYFQKKIKTGPRAHCIYAAYGRRLLCLISITILLAANDDGRDTTLWCFSHVLPDAAHYYHIHIATRTVSVLLFRSLFAWSKQQKQNAKSGLEVGMPFQLRLLLLLLLLLFLLLLLLLPSPAMSLGFTILGEIFAFVTVFYFDHWCSHIPSSWVVHAGCVFVAGLHPSRTWMSESLESVQWNACVHRLDLGLHSHPKEF